MTISAKIIADSISPEGIRLTTMQLRYPRFVHAEFMTHRVFSRNASSSRAIPVERLVEDIIRDTAMPIHWGKNQPGMQAHEEQDAPITMFDRLEKDFPFREFHSGESAWRNAAAWAIEMASAFNKAGYHKQIVNRLLEPFSHINVLCTATDWDNFFALRCHKDAQPEIRELAMQMGEARYHSTPMPLQWGEWHLPYVAADDHAQIASMVGTRWDLEWWYWDVLKRISVARCARVSYLTHEGKKPQIQKDLELYDRLVGAVPLHASPAEHQACPDSMYVYGNEWDNLHQHGNFHGWVQFRKTLPGENQQIRAI